MTRSAVNIHKRGIIKCNMKLKLMRRFMILLQHNNIRKKKSYYEVTTPKFGEILMQKKVVETFTTTPTSNQGLVQNEKQETRNSKITNQIDDHGFMLQKSFRKSLS